MSESQLPTPEQIRELPRWARVAYAARCARLSLPYFKTSTFEGWRHRYSVESAISYTERVAAFPEKYRTIQKLARRRERQALLAADFMAEPSLQVSNSLVNTPGSEAAYAAGHAVHAARGTLQPSEETWVECAVANAAGCAVRAGVAIAAVVQAWNKLTQLAQSEHWTDDTAVPATVFAPLIVDGSEELNFAEEANIEIVHTPTVPSTGHVIEVEVEVPDHWSEQQIRDHISELTHRAEMVHRAAGGNGLVVEEVRIENEVPAYVPVGK